MEYNLETEQLQLLATMIEEGRDVPRDMRRWLLVSVLEGDLLQGPKGHAYKVARSDIEELALAGLLRPQGQYDYVITPAGQRFYAECRSNEAEPAKSAEQEVKGFLDGVAFAAAYPGAHAIWAQAQALLWSADSEAELTTVGHKLGRRCRSSRPKPLNGIDQLTWTTIRLR
jgi:hypothetical protein